MAEQTLIEMIKSSTTTDDILVQQCVAVLFEVLSK
jgi:hypothetical protein